MPWLILIISALFEAVWASALGMSNGLREPVPTAVFVVASIISLYGLGRAVKHIPIGTAYAVWTGIGAALTVIYAVATGTEVLSVAKAIFLVGIVGSVIGLKLVPGDEAERVAGHAAIDSD